MNRHDRLNLLNLIFAILIFANFIILEKIQYNGLWNAFGEDSFIVTTIFFFYWWLKEHIKTKLNYKMKVLCVVIVLLLQ